MKRNEILKNLKNRQGWPINKNIKDIWKFQVTEYQESETWTQFSDFFSKRSLALKQFLESLFLLSLIS